MKITCTFEGNTVDIVDINSLEDTGFFQIVYKDASNDLRNVKRSKAELNEIIATNVTGIVG